MNSLNISNGEMVLYIMALASKIGNIKKFSDSSVYVAFQKLVEKYPDYFPGMYFRYLVGGSPHSNELENILFRMGTWNAILITNPRFQYLEVNANIIRDVEKRIKAEYGDNVFFELEKISDEFISLFPKEEKM